MVGAAAILGTRQRKAEKTNGMPQGLSRGGPAQCTKHSPQATMGPQKHLATYKPQLEPAPYGKFGAAPTTPQLVWSAEEAKDTKGAKEGEETGASGYKPQLESAPHGKSGAAPPQDGS